MAVPRSLGGDLAAQIGLANYLPRLCGGGVGSFSIMRSTATPSVASEFSLTLESIEDYLQLKHHHSLLASPFIFLSLHRRPLWPIRRWCWVSLSKQVLRNGGAFFARIRAPFPRSDGRDNASCKCSRLFHVYCLCSVIYLLYFQMFLGVYQFKSR